jgi:hypothetical protein
MCEVRTHDVMGILYQHVRVGAKLQIEEFSTVGVEKRREV